MKAVPDYSVLRFAGKHILCIGGAISIDRQHRKEAMCSDRMKGRSTRPLYWENESVIFRDEIFREISDQEIKIDTVLTHTSPSFCHPVSKNGIEHWLAEDADLSADLASERATMDRIYERLTVDGHPLHSWFYAHFHGTNTEFINGIKFSMLDILEIKEIIFEQYEPFDQL